jgi:hypothetical protein
VLIDPELTTLAEYGIDGSVAQWSAQLADGPTVGSRFRAAHALGLLDGKDPDASAAATGLATAVRDNRLHHQLRIECAKAIGELGATGGPALQSLLSAAPADARVRAAVVEQAATSLQEADALAKSSLATKLVHIFESDPSYGVRAAAIAGLGTLRAEQEMETITSALNVSSQGDRIRIAAVGVLADLDESDGLPLALKCATYGNSSSLRPAAIEALSKLYHHDPDRVFNVLVALLDDREPKTMLAAGKALSEIGGARVKSLLERRAETLKSRYWKGKTRGWLRDLKEDKPQASTR